MYYRVVSPRSIKLLSSLVFLSLLPAVVSAQQGPPPTRMPQGSQPGPPSARILQQPQPVDLSRLRTKLSNSSDDNEKLKLYGQELVRLRNMNPDTTAMLLREMNALDDADQEYIKAYEYMMESMSIRRFNPDSALSYARSANILMRPDFDTEMYIRNSVQMASLLTQLFKPIEAQAILLDLRKIHQRYMPDDIQLLIYINKELGALYSRSQATNLAIKIFNEILELDIDEVQRCSFLLSLANAYSQDQDFGKAIQTLEPCLEVVGDNSQMSMVILSSMATFHQRNKDLDQAVVYFERALATFQSESPMMSGLNFRRVLLAEVYLEGGEVQKADSMKTAIESYNDRLSPQQQIFQNVFFAELELEKGEYDRSVLYADQAIELSKRFNMENVVQDVHSIKSKALENKGDYAGAIRALREFDSLNIRRENVEKERELSEFNVRYQLNVRENELRQASATIMEMSNQMKGLAALVGIGILLSLYLFMRNRMKIALGIERTRNQIARDLHDDLSGTLSSISFFSEAAMRSEQEEKVNERFMEMIGRSANEAKEKINDIIWAIDPDKDNWQDFTLKCRRFASDLFDSKGIEYEININARALSKKNIKLRQHLWLILKELTTNIARHSDATKAEILLDHKNELIILSIRDNGKGITEEQREKGNGLKNVFRRIEDIGGKAELTTGHEGTNWMIRFTS